MMMMMVVMIIIIAFEIRRTRGASKVTVIPIVIGALGSISKRAKTWYDKLGAPKFFESVQLSTILGTTHLLRKVFSVSLSCGEWLRQQQQKQHGLFEL